MPYTSPLQLVLGTRTTLSVVADSILNGPLPMVMPLPQPVGVVVTLSYSALSIGDHSCIETMDGKSAFGCSMSTVSVMALSSALMLSSVVNVPSCSLSPSLM